MAQKVLREAAVAKTEREILHILVRQAMWTYDLLYYVHADERRETDCYWRNGYTVVTLPLVRNIIDCLHNITFILEDPGANGLWFRKSGFKKMAAAIDDDVKQYGGKPEWDEWIAKCREHLDHGVRGSGLRMTDIPTAADWPTLGRYSKMPGKGATFTPHQQFLKTFMYGHWRQYSAMAHATWEGLSQLSVYYVEDSLQIDEREKLAEGHARVMSLHMLRTAAILLCIVTEIASLLSL